MTTEMHFEVRAANGYTDDVQPDPDWQYRKEFDSAEEAHRMYTSISDYPIAQLILVLDVDGVRHDMFVPGFWLNKTSTQSTLE